MQLNGKESDKMQYELDTELEILKLEGEILSQTYHRSVGHYFLKTQCNECRTDESEIDVHRIQQKIDKLKSTIGFFPQGALLRFHHNHRMITGITNFKRAVDTLAVVVVSG